MLNRLVAETLPYFLEQRNSSTGLIADKNEKGSPSSIAVVGFGLSCYAIAAERGLMSKKDAIEKTLTILRFFYNSKQGKGNDAMGYKGFYYHFIDMETGRRAWNSEVSTIDTALFISGALSSACYFTGKSTEEKEIRILADSLYRRINWKWAVNGKKAIAHGWKPKTGFLRSYWRDDYSEAQLLYILALGSPTFPIDADLYTDLTKTFDWIKVYDIEYTYAGPLFIHQFSQLWLDLKGIKDDYSKKTGIDYFENSRRATHVHQQYAIANPHRYKHYDKLSWGLSASDGPGPARKTIKGVKRIFYDYKARGAPHGPDDGTLSPWAVVASLPFAPEIVIPAMNYDVERLRLHKGKHGFNASFNPSYTEGGKNVNGWTSSWRFGLNDGPIIMMIDNFQNGLLWKIMKRSKYIVKGLKRAGFTGGWISRYKN